MGYLHSLTRQRPSQGQGSQSTQPSGRGDKDLNYCSAQPGLTQRGAHPGEFVLRETEELSSWRVFVLKYHENLGVEGSMLSHGHISRCMNLEFSQNSSGGQALWNPAPAPLVSFPACHPSSLCPSCARVLALPQTPQAHSHSGPWHFESLLWPFYHEVVW